MMAFDIISNTYDEIRAVYKQFLSTQNLSKNTISTSVTDALYIWRKRGPELFWEIIFSDDFEIIGRNVLLEILRRDSDGDVETNINGYMSHLRKCRNFFRSETDLKIPKTDLISPSRAKSTSPQLTRAVSTPSIEQVEFYLAQWRDLEDYHLQEDALKRLFFELCPENKNITDILLKVSVLNDFYSTNIFKVFPVAKHILSLQIDDRLGCGDVTLVDDIKVVVINGRTRNFYSFATKYCSHHKPLHYPIYDSYVDEVLRYYRRKDRFANFKNDDLKNYILYKSILEKFRDFYQLNKYNLKELDQYIWQLGKTHFNKYK